MRDVLLQLAQQQSIRFVDYYLGLRFSAERPLPLLTLSLLSYLHSMGAISLSIPRLEAVVNTLPKLSDNQRRQLQTALAAHSAETRIAQLLDCSAISRCEHPTTPFLIEGTSLYFHRCWRAEKRIRHILSDRLTKEFGLCLEPYEPLLALCDADQQKAVRHALRKNCFILTGGPGTGKTTTVAALLAMFISKSSALIPKFALAAPTGKAADRLYTSLCAQLDRLPLSPAHQAVLRKKKPMTLHRLLRCAPADELLELDLVIVDEASMVGLELLSVLLEKLSPSCRLILVGDPKQLPSVEAGSIFSTLCRHFKAVNSTQTEGIVSLTTNHRAKSVPYLTQLANYLRSGVPWETLSQWLKRSANGLELSWSTTLPKACHPQFLARLVEKYNPYFLCAQRPTQSHEMLFELFELFEQCKLLTPFRQTRWGTKALNHRLDTWFRAQLHRSSEWYSGRPIMIVENCSRTGLHNGEIGIALRAEQAEQSPIQVWFREADPAKRSAFRRLDPKALPPYELAFATTVHKAQGSEFKEVTLILPSRASPLLSRALLYTAVTRAREAFALYTETEELARIMAERESLTLESGG